MTSKKLTSILTLVLFSVATSGAIAQDAPSQIFGEKIEVRVVNLEVVVEDRDGNRVLGLSDDDFKLEVDGKEMPLSFFTEVVFGRLAEKKELPPEEAPAVAPVVPSLSKVEPGEPVGTSYLVFIDNYFTTVERDRNQVLQRTIDDLGLMGPEDQMAVVAFDGRKIRMLSSWSNSQRELRRVFQDAMLEPVRGIRTGAALRDADAMQLLDQPETPASEPTNPLEDQIGNPRDYQNRFRSAQASIDYIEQQLDRIVVGVTSSMRAFAQPEGRKVMMLLSGGWPYSAFDYVHGATPLIDRAGESVVVGSKIYEPIYELANLLSYTVYTIDVPGQRRLGAHAGETDEVAMARTGPGFDDSTGATGEFAAASIGREDEEHTTLLRLASKTGGKAMLDGDREASLEEVVADTRSYYWLGFTPEWKGDDKNHRIKLDVLQKGLKIRYRTSYQDLSREKEINFLIESALMFGEVPGAHQLSVELGPPTKARGNKLTVPLELKIPMDAISMIAYQGQYVAELELQIGSLDEQGNRNEISVVPVKLSGDQPPPQGVFATYELTIKVRRKDQDLVFALLDPLNDNILAAVTKLEL